MAVVIRMKYVTRLFLLLGSLLVWLVVFTLLNDSYLKLDEYLLLGGVLLIAFAQTWVLSAVLHT